MSPHDLKAWRERLGLTQTEAAALLGMSLRSYHRHEREGVFLGELPGCVAAAAYGAAIALGQARRVLTDCGFNAKDVHAQWFRMKRDNVNAFAERQLAHRILRLHRIPRGSYTPVPRQAPIIISASVPEFAPQDVAGLAACPPAER